MGRPRKRDAGAGLRLAAVDGAEVPRSPAVQHACSDALMSSAVVTPATPSPDPYGGEADMLSGVLGGLTAAACAAMGDGMLCAMRDTLAADLALVEAEWRARLDLAGQQAKRMRRAVVDASLRLAQGQVLRAEAGNDISYTYSGTAWRLTAAAAGQRGTPGLAGRTVCYAYGHPLVGPGRPLPTLQARPSPAADDGIPF